MEIKRLAIPLSGIKAATVEATGEFEGHGSIFKNVDLGGDIVAPGAFSNSLARLRSEGRQVALFWMHDPSRVPGKWIDVREDSKGLYVRGVLADTELGRELRALLKLGAISGLSIGFRTIKADFDRDGHRVLREIDLHEVSLVSMPMNPRAQVATGSLKNKVQCIREYGEFLKIGFELSGRSAKRCASATWPALAREIHESPLDELENITSTLSETVASAALLAAAQRIRRI